MIEQFNSLKVEKKLGSLLFTASEIHELRIAGTRFTSLEFWKHGSTNSDFLLSHWIGINSATPQTPENRIWVCKSPFKEGIIDLGNKYLKLNNKFRIKSSSRQSR